MPNSLSICPREGGNAGKPANDTLVMLGYATSGVVLSTTRDATDADYRLFIVEDCCADQDGAVHDFLCQKSFPRQADVVQSADVIRALAA